MRPGPRAAGAGGARGPCGSLSRPGVAGRLVAPCLLLTDAGGKMGSRTRGERHTPEDRDAQTSWRHTHGEGDPSIPGDTYPNTQGEGHIHTNPRGDTQGHTEKPTQARQPSALPHDSWRESRGAHDLILAVSDLLPRWIFAKVLGPLGRPVGTCGVLSDSDSR